MFSSEVNTKESYQIKSLEKNLDEVVGQAYMAFEGYLLKKFEILPYVFPELELPDELLKMLNEKRSDDSLKWETKSKEESQDYQESLETQSSDNHMQLNEDMPKKSYFVISTDKAMNNSNCKKRVNLRSDSMKKRIKAAVNNYIFKKLSSLIKHEESQIFFFSLPSYFSNNLNFQLNKEIISMTVREIFSMIPACFSEIDKVRVNHNISMMNRLKIDELEAILSKTWKEMFDEYIASSDYEKYLEHISKRDGPAYYSSFIKQIEQFIPYFANSARVSGS